MKMQANSPRYLRKLAGGVAVILFSGIAIGSLAIPDPGKQGVAPEKFSESAMESPVASPPNLSNRCEECGVIASMREIEGDPVRSHEITIRMQNGSILRITDANPANWKQGERVKVLAGLN